MSEELVGRFVVGRAGLVGPDDGAKEILRRIQDMLLLLGDKFGAGGVPAFYVDPKDSSYWEFREFEDGEVTLRRVTRDYIATNWPSVDFDHPVSVPRPVRH